ncbi:extracellular solute-binding protein [candidate division FCPU426 bacterium]|nr:extracellular solute-binding protein [candidate division FCPU426 bacterium]
MLCVPKARPIVFFLLTACLLWSGVVVPARAANKGRMQKPKVTLVFWHWWMDHQNFFMEMAERYRMETNVKVDFQLFSSEGRHYWNKVQAAAQADILPDIIGLTDDPENIARYAKAGKLRELTREMRADKQAWEYSFFPRTINALYYPDKNIYGVKQDSYWGVPLTAMNIQIFYNKALFKKAGLDPEHPPRIWSEWVEASKKLKKAGIPPLVAGMGELWIYHTFFRAYAWPILGQEKIRNLYMGEMAYTDPGCQEVLKHFTEACAFLYPGVVSMSNKEAEIIFAGQKAAMIINGSWAVNVFEQMNPELDFGVMNFPKPDQAAFPMYVIGGLGKAAAVSTNCKHPQEAIRFLRWLSAQNQQARWARMPNEFPANLEAEEDIADKMKPFVQAMKELAPNLFLEERQEVLEVLSKEMQLLVLDEVTPMTVLQSVQKKKKELQNESF